MDNKEFSFHIRLWLEGGAGFSFGRGTAQLLSLVASRGSLRKAAEIMGMSYRRAWGRLKRLETDLGEPLLYKPGGNKLGYRLTGFGEELLRGYTDWNEKVATYALEQARHSFSSDIAMNTAHDVSNPACDDAKDED